MDKHAPAGGYVPTKEQKRRLNQLARLDPRIYGFLFEEEDDNEITAEDAEAVECMVIASQTEDLHQYIDCLPVDERRAMLGALEAAKERGVVTWTEFESLMLSIGKARARTDGRRESDRSTDRRRRTLIGTRQSRAFKERCQAAADDLGMSLNKWVCMALVKELERGSLPRMVKSALRSVRRDRDAQDETGAEWLCR